MSTIREQLANSSKMSELKDFEIISTYMADLRDLGVTPGKVAERGIEFAEDYMLAQRSELPKSVRMKMALSVTIEAAKAIGIHAGQRRAEKLKSEETRIEITQ